MCSEYAARRSCRPALLALTSPVRADLNDGKPCFTYINPPGNGLRYVCTSTSSHTVEHTAPETFTGKVWRTRITARREGEPVIYDRTFDSFSAPADDPAIQAAFADAGRFVGGIFVEVVDAPAGAVYLSPRPVQATLRSQSLPRRPSR